MGYQTLFVTGGTGFIGRRLLEALTGRPEYRVRCLTRSAPPEDCPPGVEWVLGNLAAPETYAGALRGVDSVLHLAAQTGKARPDDYVRVNVDGTRALLDAARNARVERFVYVSSIAAAYRDKRAYHYAVSKAASEEAVRGSGLPYVIVRPTLVFGADSPIWNKLTALAAMPVVPLFGNGRVRVQPIHVDDVVAGLLSLLTESAPVDCTIDLGGPDVLTMEALLGRIRGVRHGSAPRLLRVPARPAMLLLAWLERWLLRFLPVTAGQISMFVNDSVARADQSVLARMPPMMTVDQMLRALTTRA